MENKFVERLRNGDNITLFDSTTKYFHRLQLNKKSNRVCWQWLASKDRRNWVEWNNSLSLKEVCSVRGNIWHSNHKSNGV